MRAWNKYLTRVINAQKYFNIPGKNGNYWTQKKNRVSCSHETQVSRLMFLSKLSLTRMSKKAVFCSFYRKVEWIAVRRALHFFLFSFLRNCRLIGNHEKWKKSNEITSSLANKKKFIQFSHYQEKLKNLDQHFFHHQYFGWWTVQFQFDWTHFFLCHLKVAAL